MAALLWQAGDFGGGAVAPVAEPQHLRYQRSLTVPAGASGRACAVLDANVFAHAASWSGGDLRVFRVMDSGQPQEVPFAVSYSAAQPTDAVTATVRDARLRNGAIVFDLDMPRRAYTDVDLRLSAKDFVGTAVVSGSEGTGGVAKPLGTFTVFDLTGQHLARSTSLALQESSFAQLHVVLRLRGVNGGAFPDMSPGLVEGAAVPASREAQTLYTVVATIGKLTQQGASTVGKIDASAHVPIERVGFVLDPAFKGDFLRDVSVTAIPDEGSDTQPKEVVNSEIWRVTRTGDAAGEGAMLAEKLTLTAVIASNLRESATVRVEVRNGGQPPLPTKSIEQDMLQRTLFLHASTGATYTLRYGDKGLHASVYDDGRLGTISAKPILATLGPERLNPQYVAGVDVAIYDEQNPERYWILLLSVIAVLGALGSRHTKRRGRHR